MEILSAFFLCVVDLCFLFVFLTIVFVPFFLHIAACACFLDAMLVKSLVQPFFLCPCVFAINIFLCSLHYLVAWCLCFLVSDKVFVRLWSYFGTWLVFVNLWRSCRVYLIVISGSMGPCQSKKNLCNEKNQLLCGKLDRMRTITGLIELNSRSAARSSKFVVPPIFVVAALLFACFHHYGNHIPTLLVVYAVWNSPHSFMFLTFAIPTHSLSNLSPLYFSLSPQPRVSSKQKQDYSATSNNIQMCTQFSRNHFFCHATPNLQRAPHKHPTQWSQ